LIAIGVTNGGYEKFFGFFYSRLGVDVSPRMQHYFKTKDRYTEKRQVRQRQTETKQKRSSNNAKKMHEENAMVMKDAKANKTYLCASFMRGDEIADEQQQEQQSAKRVPFCNLPNCTNPKGHAWNTAKKCRWHGQFMHIKTRTNKGKQEIKAAVIAHLQ
jgi:hypothetical protein